MGARREQGGDVRTAQVRRAAGDRRRGHRAVHRGAVGDVRSRRDRGRARTLETILSLVFWILAIVIFFTLFAGPQGARRHGRRGRRAGASRGTCSATRGPACCGCRFGCSSASRSSRPGCTSSSPTARPSAPAGSTAARRCSATGRAPSRSRSRPGRAAITFEWYRDFLNVLINNDAQVWFGWLIVFGEIAVGIGLIFGVLTGFAAFFGAMMNMSFLLAGSASTNPVLFALGDRPHPGLARRGLLRRRPLAAPPPRSALARQGRRTAGDAPRR